MTVCAGAVYADVLCHCVNTKSSCVSRAPVTADGDDNDADDDVAVTSRRVAATGGGVETAALSTILVTSPSFRSAARAPRSSTRSVAPRPTTTAMIVAVDSHVIEMQRMGDDGDDQCPAVAV